jgi:hypothetical protein
MGRKNINTFFTNWSNTETLLYVYIVFLFTHSSYYLLKYLEKLGRQHKTHQDEETWPCHLSFNAPILLDLTLVVLQYQNWVKQKFICVQHTHMYRNPHVHLCLCICISSSIAIIIVILQMMNMYFSILFKNSIS